MNYCLVVVFLGIFSSLSSKASTSGECLQQIDAAVDWYYTQPAWANILLDLDPEDTCLQIQNQNSVTFPEALKSAIETWSHDGSHLESPLNISIDLALEVLNRPYSDRDNPDVIQKGREIMEEHLARPNTRIRLLKLAEENPYGPETPHTAWIFRMKIPSLSDHIFIAIVPRDGSVPAYNYGFN